MSDGVTKPTFLFDTGPLSVLCSFPRQATPYIYAVLRYTDLVLPEAVIAEAGRGKIIQTLSPLLKDSTIKSMAAPIEPLIVDTAYSRDLGIGERAAIKCALSTGLPVVIDDQDAFMAACRFGLHPMVFQDFIVKLVLENDMPISLATEIVRTTARQFPATYLTHTLDKLG